MKKWSNLLMQMHTYLIRQAMHMQCTKLISSDMMFRKWLEYIMEVGFIDIPPTTFLSFKSIRFWKSVFCEGFTLTNWLSNNFAIVQTARVQLHIIFEKDINFDEKKEPYCTLFCQFFQSKKVCIKFGASMDLPSTIAKSWVICSQSALNVLLWRNTSLGKALPLI